VQLIIPEQKVVLRGQGVAIQTATIQTGVQTRQAVHLNLPGITIALQAVQLHPGAVVEVAAAEAVRLPDHFHVEEVINILRTST
jgi:hypothetical protein